MPSIVGKGKLCAKRDQQLAHLGTLIRLDALRKTLDGDAAKSLDQLLARLNGQRKVWESGEVVGDLKTTLFAEKDTGLLLLRYPLELPLSP